MEPNEIQNLTARVDSLDRVVRFQQEIIDRLAKSAENQHGAILALCTEGGTHGTQICGLWKGLRELSDIILAASSADQPLQITEVDQERTRRTTAELEKLFKLDPPAESATGGAA
ncbi:MAG: hypothetical protein ABIP80_06115 [Ferruginibacter sp.]